MILCYDISQIGSSLLIADANGTQVKAAANNVETRGFSLPDALAELWQQAGCTPNQLSKLIVTLGPGSYTGIRAGLAVLQAYRLALPEATYIGMSNLYLMAWRARQDILALDEGADKMADIGVIAHTKRKDFFWQSFDSQLSAVSEAMVLDGQSLSEILQTYPNKLILTGNNVMPFLTDYPLDIADIIIHPTEPKAQDLLQAHLASPLLGKNQWQPLYLKPPDTTPRKALRK